MGKSVKKAKSGGAYKHKTWAEDTAVAYADHPRSKVPLREGKAVLEEVRHLYYEGERSPVAGKKAKKASAHKKGKKASAKKGKKPSARKSAHKADGTAFAESANWYARHLSQMAQATGLSGRALFERAASTKKSASKK